MLIGHIEFVRERVEHMSALRDMQDYSHCGLGLGIADWRERREVVERAKARWPGVFAKSAFRSAIRDPESAIPGSYTAFIHWPFQRENTPLGRAKEWDPDVHGPFDDSVNDDVLKGPRRRMAGAQRI
jgi:2-iminoacetate synthase ThiH